MCKMLCFLLSLDICLEVEFHWFVLPNEVTQTLQVQTSWYGRTVLMAEENKATHLFTEETSAYAVCSF